MGAKIKKSPFSKLPLKKKTRPYIYVRIQDTSQFW